MPVPVTALDPALQQEMLERVEARGVWDRRGRRPVLDRPVQVVVGRICDAEPLLQPEAALTRAAADRIVRGLGAVALLRQAERVILAVDRDRRRLLQRLEDAAADTRLELVPLPAAAPMDDDSLVCDLAHAAGKSVPAAGLLDRVVLDAVELADLALALEGRWPAELRTVAVGGAVERPAVVQAPLGTRLADLVAVCGGAPDPGWAAWHNGALSGRRVAQDHVVDLDTRGYVVLPHDHPLVGRETVPLQDIVARIGSACEACRICTDLCPVFLAGGHLRPHQVMRAIASGWESCSAQPDAAVLGALECLEGCSLCSAACPALLEPARVIRALAGRLRGSGVGLDRGFALRPHADRAGRRVSLSRLTDMLGLGAHVVQRPRTVHLVPETIVIPPVGPTGAPRVVVVQPGERVAPGDLLAAAGAGAFEADVRSPVAARVREVDRDDGVVLDVR